MRCSLQYKECYTRPGASSGSRPDLHNWRLSASQLFCIKRITSFSNSNADKLVREWTYNPFFSLGACGRDVSAICMGTQITAEWAKGNGNYDVTLY